MKRFNCTSKACVRARAPTPLAFCFNGLECIPSARRAAKPRWTRIYSTCHLLLRLSSDYGAFVFGI